MEFALVSVPFVMLLMGVFELGLIFFLSTTLDNALGDAARQIRTGQLQTGSTSETAAAFKTDVCNRLNWLAGECSTNLSTDVRTFDKFVDVSMPDPATGGTYNPAVLNGYVNSEPCKIVVVRAYYKWNLIAPALNTALKQLSDGSRLIISTVAFKNEPFTPTTGTSAC